MKVKNILLTGAPGCGKTTVVMKVLERLKGIKAGGFYTEEIRKKGERVGFKIRSLDGRESILAHVDFKSPHKVSKYKVSIENLDNVGADALIKAKRDANLIVIDEIGKMELFSDLVKLSILEAISSPKKVLATIKEKGDPFVDVLKERADTEVLEITKENRDKLPETIIDLLCE